MFPRVLFRSPTSPNIYGRMSFAQLLCTPNSLEYKILRNPDRIVQLLAQCKIGRDRRRQRATCPVVEVVSINSRSKRTLPPAVNRWSTALVALPTAWPPLMSTLCGRIAKISLPALTISSSSSIANPQMRSASGRLGVTISAMGKKNFHQRPECRVVDQIETRRRSNHRIDHNVATA